jgi:hypothetical protein
MKNVLYLEASDAEHPRPSGVGVEDPVWPHVEMRIEGVFKFGGQVVLYAGIRRDDGKLQLGTFLGMESHAGECRLIYTPDKSPGEKTKWREWWEPGDAPFRGTANFNDHEWDDRTVCRDMSVAIQMFRDFFDHGDLTEAGLSQTRSVWGRKPR